MKNIILLLTLCLFYSCVDNDAESTCKNYAINLSSITEGLNDATLVDSIHYVELETTLDNMIGEISKVQIDSFIALSDRMTNALHLYSPTGAFLSAISAIGNGPGEYVRIDDFIMRVDRDEIHILDGTQNKIIIYSLAGKFIEEKKLLLSPGIARFTMQGDSYVYDQQIRRGKSDDCYHLIVTSSDGNTLNRYLPYEKTSDLILSPRNSLFYVNDTLAYLPTYSHIVYHVFENRVEPRFSFDFGDKWIDKEYMLSDVHDPMSFIDGLKATKGIYFFNVTESGSHLFLDYMYKGEKYGTIISKLDDVIKTYRDLSGNDCILKNAPMTTFGDFFVTSLPKYELPDVFDESEFENSNPVLMFFKFK